MASTVGMDTVLSGFLRGQGKCRALYRAGTERALSVSGRNRGEGMFPSPADGNAVWGEVKNDRKDGGA